ncbi:MAG TPA: glycosyltransferase family 2 protein [Pirellulales bacterium]|nr:glycosyltransferase family 2 protein [Pirellulales bacterium]
MASVSLTVIVRNEEAVLPGLLRDVADLFDDIVVVDTGSTDRTREVAAAACPRVRWFEFPWCDDFSAARNEALRHARGEWVFWLDADDQLERTSRDKLRDLFAHLPDGNPMYLMPCVSRTPWCEHLAPVIAHHRLFRNRPDIRFAGRVFENVQTANPHLKCTSVPITIPIHHQGYADLSQFLRKLERNRRLFVLEQEELGERLKAISLRLRQTDQTLPIYRRLVELDVLLRSGPNEAIRQEQEQLKWRLAHPAEPVPASWPANTTLIVG